MGPPRHSLCGWRSLNLGPDHDDARDAFALFPPSSFVWLCGFSRALGRALATPSGGLVPSPLSSRASGWPGDVAAVVTRYASNPCARPKGDGPRTHAHNSLRRSLFPLPAGHALGPGPFVHGARSCAALGTVCAAPPPGAPHERGLVDGGASGSAVWLKGPKNEWRRHAYPQALHTTSQGARQPRRTIPTTTPASHVPATSGGRVGPHARVHGLRVPGRPRPSRHLFLLRAPEPSPPTHPHHTHAPTPQYTPTLTRAHTHTPPPLPPPPPRRAKPPPPPPPLQAKRCRPPSATCTPR